MLIFSPKGVVTVLDLHPQPPCRPPEPGCRPHPRTTVPSGCSRAWGHPPCRVAGPSACASGGVGGSLTVGLDSYLLDCTCEEMSPDWEQGWTWEVAGHPGFGAGGPEASCCRPGDRRGGREGAPLCPL